MNLYNLPLTETVYYILLALTEPTHGYVLMQRVEELSGGEVRLAAGTLYGAVENLLKKGFITSMPSDDVRRKVYAISQAGDKILRADYKRMSHMSGFEFWRSFIFETPFALMRGFSWCISFLFVFAYGFLTIKSWIIYKKALRIDINK